VSLQVVAGINWRLLPFVCLSFPVTCAMMTLLTYLQAGEVSVCGSYQDIDKAARCASNQQAEA
jgi:hypothetical protein